MVDHEKFVVCLCKLFGSHGFQRRRNRNNLQLAPTSVPAEDVESLKPIKCIHGIAGQEYKADAMNFLILSEVEYLEDMFCEVEYSKALFKNITEWIMPTRNTQTSEK